MDIKAALTQKVGPFPGFVWVGIIAVGGWLLLKARGSRGTSSGTPIYAPGPPGVGPQGVQGPPGPAGVGVPGSSPGGSVAGSPPIYSSAPGPGPLGELWAAAQAAILGYSPNPNTNPGITFYPVGYAGPITGYSNGKPYLDPSVGALPQAGVGGPKSIGSRRAQIMAAHHPDLKRSPGIPHVVQAIGGPATHFANVHRIARAAGVHPARLLTLNPHHTGLIHIQ